MSSDDGLNKMFSNIIFLIYRNKCIWEGELCDVTCKGNLQTSHLIPRRDHYFAWDMNNAVVMCDQHHKWWHGTLSASRSQDEAYQFLLRTHPKLVNFMIDNKHSKHMFKPNLDDIRAFLIQNSNEAIKKGYPYFPSLYGNFNL